MRLHLAMANRFISQIIIKKKYNFIQFYTILYNFIQFYTILFFPCNKQKTKHDERLCLFLGYCVFFKERRGFVLNFMRCESLKKRT